MLNNLERIPSSVRSPVEQFFTRLLGAFQEEKIDSVYLYGSVAAGDFLPERSDINSLILFDSFGAMELQIMRPLVRDGLKKRIVAPLCLSVQTFRRSADTFPLEFIEIKDKHLLLFGLENRVDALEIPREYLRVKIEEQIKGKLIRLRQVWMEHPETGRELTEILVDTQRQLFPVFRNLLRFLGIDRPPISRDEILRELENRAQFALLPCRQVWEHAAGRASIQGNVSSIYSDYIDALLKLATLIDRLEA